MELYLTGDLEYIRCVFSIKIGPWGHDGFSVTVMIVSYTSENT